MFSINTAAMCSALTWRMILATSFALASLSVLTPFRRDDLKPVGRAEILTRPCTHKSRLVSSGWSMSALPPEADIRQRIEHVCLVPMLSKKSTAMARTQL
jgi:hypothetical protein